MATTDSVCRGNRDIDSDEELYRKSVLRRRRKEDLERNSAIDNLSEIQQKIARRERLKRRRKLRAGPVHSNGETRPWEPNGEIADIIKGFLNEEDDWVDAVKIMSSSEKEVINSKPTEVKFPSKEDDIKGRMYKLSWLPANSTNFKPKYQSEDILAPLVSEIRTSEYDRKTSKDFLLLYSVSQREGELLRYTGPDLTYSLIRTAPDDAALAGTNYSHYNLNTVPTIQKNKLPTSLRPKLEQVSDDDAGTEGLAGPTGCDNAAAMPSNERLLNSNVSQIAIRGACLNYTFSELKWPILPRRSHTWSLGQLKLFWSLVRIFGQNWELICELMGRCKSVGDMQKEYEVRKRRDRELGVVPRLAGVGVSDKMITYTDKAQDSVVPDWFHPLQECPNWWRSAQRSPALRQKPTPAWAHLDAFDSALCCALHDSVKECSPMDVNALVQHAVQLRHRQKAHLTSLTRKFAKEAIEKGVTADEKTRFMQRLRVDTAGDIVPVRIDEVCRQRERSLDETGLPTAESLLHSLLEGRYSQKGASMFSVKLPPLAIPARNIQSAFLHEIGESNLTTHEDILLIVIKRFLIVAKSAAQGAHILNRTSCEGCSARGRAGVRMSSAEHEMFACERISPCLLSHPAITILISALTTRFQAYARRHVNTQNSELCLCLTQLARRLDKEWKKFFVNGHVPTFALGWTNLLKNRLLACVNKTQKNVVLQDVASKHEAAKLLHELYEEWVRSYGMHYDMYRTTQRPLSAFHINDAHCNEHHNWLICVDQFCSSPDSMRLKDNEEFRWRLSSHHRSELKAGDKCFLWRRGGSSPGLIATGEFISNPSRTKYESAESRNTNSTSFAPQHWEGLITAKIRITTTFYPEISASCVSNSPEFQHVSFFSATRSYNFKLTARQAICLKDLIQSHKNAEPQPKTFASKAADFVKRLSGGVLQAGRQFWMFPGANENSEPDIDSATSRNISPLDESVVERSESPLPSEIRFEWPYSEDQPCPSIYYSEPAAVAPPVAGRSFPQTYNDINLWCCLCARIEPSQISVICDCCERSFHLNCTSPPLKRAPLGDWYCHECSRRRTLDKIKMTQLKRYLAMHELRFHCVELLRQRAAERILQLHQLNNVTDEALFEAGEDLDNFWSICAKALSLVYSSQYTWMK